MQYSRFYLFTLISLVLVLGYLSYLIIKPFLLPIIWAIVLSIVSYPLYAFILRFIRWRSIASFVSLVVIVVVILGPFSYFSILIAVELAHLSDFLQSGKIETLTDPLRHPAVKALIDKVTAFLGITEGSFSKALEEGLSKLGKEVLGRVTSGIGNVITGVIDFLLMTFAIFFFLRDGPEFLQKARDYLPFSEAQKAGLEGRVRDIVVSTIYGGVTVAIIQGIIAGITFSLLELNTPVLWGFLLSVATFVPLFGSFTVWGPIAGYLFFQGAIAKGVILVIVGASVISTIDNFLRPVIIGGRTKMPVLVILFSILGGIKLFGVIGLIMGPLVIAIFVSVIQIFRNIEGGNHA